MGSKLYPPYIDGKIPAFCGTVLRVPFRQNRAISSAQYSAIACKLKTVSTNEWKWTIVSNQIYQEAKTGNWYVDFNLDQINNEDKQRRTYAQLLSIGYFYKLQIAYVGIDENVGYFSDVGVVKYTAVPRMFIEGLTSGTNGSKYNYIGVYQQRGASADVTEKVYTYQFIMVDEKGETFFESGIQLHNSSLDVNPDESRDVFNCNKELKTNHKYRLKYSVVTINGLEYSSDTYYIIKKATVKPSLNATLHAEPNYDNGYIHVYLNAEDDSAASGSFSICRASSLDNFETWNEVCQFSLSKETPMKELFNDFAVEQGVRYCYSLQQFNTRGLYSNRLLSETVTADFEDMYLYDGKRQLKIRFNPNVSTFKNDILESKMDTIGGKYPFIFRNGNVKYKEFPIGGLISYLMDDQAFFLDKTKLGILDMETTDLTSDNIRAERIFKLEVMEWLTNGEPKLFKSPTEGNYFVRLMNVSLSPNATVGRMLHSFTATAYEIGDVDFETLSAAGLFVVPDYQATIMHFMTINLGDEEYRTPLITTTARPTLAQMNNAIRNKQDQVLDIPYVYLGEFSNVAPGSIIALQYDQKDSHDRTWTFITIGGTEVYKINTGDNPVIGIYLVWTPASTKWFDGLFTFGYYAENITDAFNLIYNYTTEDKLGQFVGKHNDLIAEDGNIYSSSTDTRSYNYLKTTSANTHLVTGLEDIKTSIGRFYWLKFSVREIKKAYFKIMNDKLYICKDEGQQVYYLAKEIIDISVYADYTQDPVRYYDGRDLRRMLTVDWFGSDYAQFPKTLLNNANYYWTDETKEPWTSNPNDTYLVDRLYKFSINHQDRNIDLKTVGRYIITDLENIKSISLGRMLILDCYYQTSNIEYTVENQLRGSALSAKNTYNTNKSNFYSIWERGKDPEPEGTTSQIVSQDEIDSAIVALDKSYRTYCSYVKSAIESETEV